MVSKWKWYPLTLSPFSPPLLTHESKVRRRHGIGMVATQVRDMKVSLRKQESLRTVPSPSLSRADVPGQHNIGRMSIKQAGGGNCGSQTVKL